MEGWLSLLLTDVGRDAWRPHHPLGTHHFQLPNLGNWLSKARNLTPSVLRFRMDVSVYVLPPFLDIRVVR
jgi:hypothetical protein